ncbi:MAG: cytochrome C oxidase subunit II [Acidobacteria bacterium]|nr:cytochrome C oxidase subunit II [Acidobacteriota bacterium]
MVDSTTVLWGQTLAYTFYVLAIMAVMGWFALRVTQDGGRQGIRPAYFYAFVGFLVVLGVSLHFITYYTIPWKPMDMHRATITPDKVFDIGVAAHKFQLPAEKLLVACNDKVLFNVTSSDLTYGFGLFRNDHSMLFQMQVVPGHKNDILWQFDKPGIYTIRSTEYSGPSGVDMILKDVVVVSCVKS